MEAKDDRSLVEAAIEVWRLINVELGTNPRGDENTFCLHGDLDKVPCLAWDFLVLCSFCGNIFALCPLQNTLRHNLMQHASSADHQKQAARGSTHALMDQVGRPVRIDSRDRKQKGNLMYYPLSTGQDSGPVGRLAKIGGKDQKKRENLMQSPILTGQIGGRVGGPVKVDSEDRKQKEIFACFQKSRSTSQPYDNADVMLDTIHWSRLCWGYRSKFLQGKDEVTRSHYNRLGGDEWFCEPYTGTVLVNLETGVHDPFDGIFRHRACSRLSSHKHGGSERFTCEKCHSIPFLSDFPEECRDEGTH